MHNAQSYNSIPISVKKFDPICPRIYQLLFNEIVDIIEYKQGQVLISTPHCFYQQAGLFHKNTRFWTPQNTIISLNELYKKGIDTSLFPEPLSFSVQSSLNNKTVSLKLPFFDHSSGKTFLAGTRFNIVSSDKNYVSVYVYDHPHSRSTIKKIPKKLCVEYTNLSKQECLKRFMNIITTWAHPSHGFIPYVLGGSSVSTLCTQPFDEVSTSHNSIYTRKEMHPPYTGLDCAGLIIRAAQVAGIPFYFKNSYTIAHYLKPIQSPHDIHEGDIIWIPGHVMIVSSLNKGLLIEARSYEHGYGKVHEIPLSEEFKNINTYHDLSAAYFSKTPLERLDKTGTVRQVIKDIKILKLESAWQA